MNFWNCLVFSNDKLEKDSVSGKDKVSSPGVNQLKPSVGYLSRQILDQIKSTLLLSQNDLSAVCLREFFARRGQPIVVTTMKRTSRLLNKSRRL